MSEKRRALGRGLGALIPSGAGAAERPVDVFFRDPDRVHALTGPRPQPTPGTAHPPSRPAAPTVRTEWPRGNRHPPSTAVQAGEDADSGGLRPVPGAEFAEIPLDQIRPNPRQPRRVFDEDELAELVHSIREIGVLQPVVVRRVPDGHGPARCATS